MPPADELEFAQIILQNGELRESVAITRGAQGQRFVVWERKIEPA